MNECFYLFYFSVQLARQSRIHSYGKSFNGFVARLLPHEAERLKGWYSEVMH